MQIDPASIKDFFRAYRLVTADAAMRNIPELVSVLPLLERADAPEGEQAAVQALMRKEGAWAYEPLIRHVIHELCNYPPEARGEILNAALSQASPIAETAWTLESMQPTVFASFRDLDGRTKAILGVLEELRYAGNWTDTRFCEIPRTSARWMSTPCVWTLLWPRSWRPTTRRE